MKAVIIGASEEALHTIEKAHEYGLEVTALDGNPGAAGLKAADRSLVVDISDEKATIEAVKAEKADFILTVPIGRFLTTIGAVNDALCLPGISKEMAVLCTDKYSFHKKLAMQKLRNCHCYAAGSSKEEEITGRELSDQAAAGILALSFPAILKPRYGSGSRGIYMISNAEELQKALRAAEGEPYILEECVPGEEYGVDGAVIDGKFYLVLLRRKENTPPPARQAVAYFSVLQADLFHQQVKEYMEKVISCLGLRECLLHADIIRGEEGPFVIELSARPSGHNLHNLFTPLCTGVDVAEEYIKYRIGKNFSFVPKETKAMMIHYFDMEGEVEQVPDENAVRKKIQNSVPEAALIQWNCNIQKGEVLGRVCDGHSVMGRGYFVLEGNTREVLSEAAEIIKEQFF